MAYTRNPTWQNDPSTATPITAAKLEHMEDGIEQGAQAASEVLAGNVELASAAEMSAGTDLTRPPSVKRVADYIASYVTAAIGGISGAGTASESTAGIVELASAAEMSAAADLTRPPSVKRVADYITTYVASAIATLSASMTSSLAGKANVSGSISQFADVEDIPAADGDILRYDTTSGQYLALDPTTQFAAVGSDGRIVSSARPQYYVPTLIINEGGTVPGSFPSGGIVFSRPAGGGGAVVPSNIGQGTASNGTSHTITTTAALAPGDYLAIAVVTADDASTPTFTFATGAAAQTLVATSQSVGTVRVSLYQGKVTTAIPSGTVVTITHSAFTARSCVMLIDIPALVSSAPVDVNVTGTGTSNSTLAKTVGPTSTTTIANEIAIQAWGYNAGTVAGGNARSVDSASGWTGLGSIPSVAGSSERGLHVGYKVLTATGTVTGNGQFTAMDGASGAWAALVATFKKA